MKNPTEEDRTHGLWRLCYTVKYKIIQAHILCGLQRDSHEGLEMLWANATEKILINSNGVWSSVQYLLDALGTSDYGSIHGARAMMHQEMMSPPSHCVCGILEGFQCLLGRKSALPTPSGRKVAICLQLKSGLQECAEKRGASRPRTFVTFPTELGRHMSWSLRGRF